MRHHYESPAFEYGYHPSPTYAPNTNSIGGNLHLNKSSATHSWYDCNSNNSPPTLPLMMGGLSLSSTSGHGQFPTTESGSGDNTNAPQNLRDSPERRAKVKTEMCTYYMKGGVESCPYGNKCECILSMFVYYYAERKYIVSYSIFIYFNVLFRSNFLYYALMYLY